MFHVSPMMMTMAVSRLGVWARGSSLFANRRVSIRVALVVAVVVGGIAAGAVILLNRSSGPLYGCSSVTNCKSVATGHGLKHLAVLNAQESNLRFQNGTVDVEGDGYVDLVINLADPTHAPPTTVMFSAGLHRGWTSICSSPKAQHLTTPSGTQYCSIVEYCSGSAYLSERGTSYSVQIFGKPGCAADYASGMSSRLKQIVNTFS